MLLYKKTRSVVLKRAGESVEVGGWDCACVDYCESEFLFCSLSPPILFLNVFRIVNCDVIRAELLSRQNDDLTGKLTGFGAMSDHLSTKH